MGLKERRIINKIYYLKFVLTIGYSTGSKSKEIGNLVQMQK